MTFASPQPLSAAAGQERPSRPPRRIYAALDLGTNNCRLLIARPAPEGFQVIDAFSRIVRLGEGLAASGRLGDTAIERTLDALSVCAGKMRRRGVTRARLVATEACRRATNGPAFLARAAAETGLALEIISPREEAELALAGCAPLLDARLPHALVFDIGGGSTEMSWLSRQTGTGRAVLRASLSLPLGVVTLAERHGEAAQTPEGFRRMGLEVAAALTPAKALMPLSAAIAAGRVQMLGTSGTVTTLAGVHLDLPRYDRGQVDGCFLDFSTIAEATQRILGLDASERAQHPCIGQGRADLVVAGCAILSALCQAWPVGRLRVADRGLREGLLLSLMQSHRRNRP